REATLLGHFETATPAVAAGLLLARSYLAPAAATVLDRRALWECGLTADWRWTLALKLEGYAREVDAARDQAVGAIRDAGGRVEGADLPATFWIPDHARPQAGPRPQRDPEPGPLRRRHLGVLPTEVVDTIDG